jgi:hypothetical protein
MARQYVQLLIEDQSLFGDFSTVAWLAHARRKVADVHKARGPANPCKAIRRVALR